MEAVTHIIERQVLDLTLGTDREAQTRQEIARQVLQDRVQPVLDEVFTRIAGPDRVLRLDRLHIDLGVLSADRWMEQLVERLREQIEQELQQHIHGVMDGEASGVSKTVAQSRLAAFLYFLDTGSLPWWMPQASSFDPSDVLADLIQSQPDALRVGLREGYRSMRAHRLVAQVASEVIEPLRLLLAPAAASRISRVIQAWQRMNEANLSFSEGQLPSRVDVERVVLDLILSSGSSVHFSEEKLHEVISETRAAQGGSVDDLVDAIAQLPETEVAMLAASEAGSLLTWLRKVVAPASHPMEEKWTAKEGMRSDAAEHQKKVPALESRISEQQQKTKKSGTARHDSKTTAHTSSHDHSESVDAHGLAREGANTHLPSSHAEAEKSHQDSIASSSAREEARTNKQTDLPSDRPFLEAGGSTYLEAGGSAYLEGQTFYVTNAGLVLLWPFLGRFFKKLNLVEDKAFRTPALQQRAVLLTHYLVTGEAEAPEQVLLLNKILCGWPPEATVPKIIHLTPEERAESQVLLEAAIAQWAILKNTSLAGLQQAFLQREGRLEKQPEAWALKVDRTGYDVLLDRLPWSIAVVKQAWMPHPLFVEW